MKTKISVTVTNFGDFWKARIGDKEISKETLFNLLLINPDRHTRLDSVLRGLETKDYFIDLWERDIT